jgi:membrane-associated phospholipid phosphatase
MSCRSLSRLAPVLLLVSSLSSCLRTPVSADPPFSRQVNDFFSGTGNLLYLAAGVGLPLVEDGRAGRSNTLRVAESAGITVGLTEGLKALVQEKRPDSAAHDSFPSGHASAAFSVASVESALHPRQTALWYGGATLISASRIFLHRHTVGDVLVGSALGYGVGRWEMSSRRGILLRPWIQPETRSLGVTFFHRF